MTVYRCKRGATLVIPLNAVGASDADLVGITIDAGVKAAVNGTVPSGSTPRIATFTVTPRAAVDAIPPGWNLTLTDAQTEALEPGVYVTDAAITLPGGSAVQISDVLSITLEQTVSV